MAARSSDVNPQARAGADATPPHYPDVNELYARLRDNQVLPVLRADDCRAAVDDAHRIVASGLDVIELTTTIPGWEGAVAALRAHHPDVCIGVGTVCDAELARRAVDAGAHFCVSPGQSPTARTVLEEVGMAFVEGGMTPTEVLSSARHGIAKLFPAHVGGPTYLRSLLAVAPDARIVPTGGIDLAEVRSWLAAGAVAVGVGSKLASTPDLRADLLRLRESP